MTDRKTNLTNIDWIAVEKEYEIVRLEVPNNPRLKTSLTICARASERCHSRNNFFFK